MFTKLSSFSLAPVYALLTDFAHLDNFWDLFDRAFGTQYDSISAASLRSQWLAGDFKQFPPIEVVSSQVLGSANGAYAISTNTVYLSDRFVSTANAEDLTAVVLEEFGHFVDAQVNQVDTTGDEGELFSDLVRGGELSSSELTRIQTEDDHAVISLDGQLISVEEAFNKTGYKQLGTPYTDNGYAISTDSSGNVYISGRTLSDSGISGNNSSFLAKYNANGNQVWFKQDQSDTINDYGISLDRSGNIYVPGTGNEGYLPIFGLGASLTKFDASGIKVWTKYFYGFSGGFPVASGAIGTSTDSSGDIYVGDTFGGDYTFTLAKYDTNGNQIWVHSTSSGYDARGISTDSGKNVYVTGKTSSSLPGNSNLGGDDAFVIEYDTNGTQLWVKQFGTPSSDSAKAITTDSNDNIYITGTTGTVYDGNSVDAFVAKYNTNGTQLWFKQFGTPSSEDTRGISTDSNGNVYVAGSTSEKNNAFVAKFDTNGTQIWMKQFDQTYGATGISTDGSGNSYISETTGGTLID